MIEGKISALEKSYGKEKITRKGRKRRTNHWGNRVNKITQGDIRVNLKHLGYFCCFASFLGRYEKRDFYTNIHFF